MMIDRTGLARKPCFRGTGTKREVIAGPPDRGRDWLVPVMEPWDAVDSHGICIWRLHIR